MVGQFNARIKCVQIENSLSYCVIRSKLRRSERALMVTPDQKESTKMTNS